METNLFTNAAAQNSNPAGVALNGASNEGRDMFTKLLVAQIQNQDPLSPQDPSQFVQQLTQLSQTEALQNLAGLTSANASVLQSMQVIALGGQVGTNVMVNVDQVKLDEDKVSGIVTLDAISTGTKLVLTSSNGTETKIDLGTLGTGSSPFTIDPVALKLKEGTYKIKVVTSSGAEAPVDIEGRLNSVRLGANGSVVMNVAHVGEVGPETLTSFNGKSATVAAASTPTVQ